MKSVTKLSLILFVLVQVSIARAELKVIASCEAFVMGEPVLFNLLADAEKLEAEGHAVAQARGLPFRATDLRFEKKAGRLFLQGRSSVAEIGMGLELRGVSTGQTMYVIQDLDRETFQKVPEWAWPPNVFECRINE